jgi:sporulation protein YlmC with PRC-barrel domain
MRASRFTKALVAGLVVAVFGASQVLADDPQAKQLPQTPNYQTTPQHATTPARPGENDRALVIRTLPSKKVVGANIENAKGEKVGSIDDLVIDLQSGKVQYVAVAVGGVLGVGEKLFAVPFEEFKTTHDTSNNIMFVLDIPKDRLENAPGFDKSHWPDFASPEWRNQIDTYYHRTSANRPVDERAPRENR